tara:strand:+ start:557 stop:1135 length:579 start_codon:yes stop_codon:yes gene_type:complete
MKLTEAKLKTIISEVISESIDDLGSYRKYLAMDDIPVDSEDYEDHIKDASTGNCGKFTLTLLVRLLELREKGIVKDIDLMILYDKQTVSSPEGINKIEDLIGSFVNHAFVFADGFYYDVNGRFNESELSSHLKDYTGSMDEPFLNYFEVNNLNDIRRYHSALNDMGSLDNRSCSGYESAVDNIIMKTYFNKK